MIKLGWKNFLRIVAIMGIWSNVNADIIVKKVAGDLEKDFMSDSLWKQANTDQNVSMMAQTIVIPKPKATETPQIQVAAIHDGKWIAFRMKWKDTEPSEAGRLATFSDAVALEFPIKNNEAPPPIFMGAKDDPVHLFHWRYQYQLDAEVGKKTIEKIYPNMTTDMYPMDFKDQGHSPDVSQKDKDAFVGGLAAGNPQSFPKSGVDEIFAEGFGSSAVADSHMAKAKGEWKNNEWTVVITRPLAYENGSKLKAGGKSNVGFAVWQGGKKEVGALKSLTMVWTPLMISEQ